MTEDRRSGLYGEHERDSTAARRERKWQAFKDIMRAAWEGSAEFQARMKAAGLRPDDITGWDDAPRIPVFRKKELIALQQEQGVQALLTCAPGELSRIYMSPGPIFDPEGREEDYWGWTEAFYAAGFREGDVAQMTFSYHLTPAGLMLEEPLREIGCAVVPAGPGNTGVQIELMQKLPVNAFVGMASYLKVIRDKAGDALDDIDLDVAFVAAERLPESLRAELEQGFGMLVRQGYGTADVGCIAYECPELTGMHVSSRCWVEVCDPATGQPLPMGETGEVVVTPFSRAYPLVRLATGDLSYFAEGACPCGRTAPRLGGIVGRVDATAKVKGQFIYPHQVAEVCGAFVEVCRWQVVVDNPGGKDALTLKLHCESELDQGRFVAAFQDKLKLRPAIELVNAGDIAEDAQPLLDNRKYD